MFYCVKDFIKIINKFMANKSRSVFRSNNPGMMNCPDKNSGLSLVSVRVNLISG